VQVMAESIYFQCRKAAAEHNEKLKSRPGAAELLGVSESSLAHYELGVTKTVPVDVVVMMAELYGAPELKNLYCKNECPIGRDCPVATREVSIEEATVHLLGGMQHEAMQDAAKTLLRIAADGVLTPEEAAELEPMQAALDIVCKAVSELKILVEKTRKRKGERHGAD